MYIDLNVELNGMDKKILIVESYDGMRKYIRKTLQRAGYDIIEAVNAEDALAKLSRPELQMIITGFMLEGMDGIELTQTLKTQTPHHNTPVVLMTSDNTGTVKDKAIEAGINDWIKKPFKPHQLIKLVENQINPLPDN